MKNLISTPDYTVNQFDSEISITILNPMKSGYINRGLRIAYTISDSVYSLKDLAYSLDLKKHLDICINTNNYVGLSFLLHYLKVPKEKIKGDVAYQLMIEMLDFLAIRYFKLWELIRASFPKLKTIILNCPKKAELLFLKIIEYEQARGFEVMVENSYVEYNPKKLKEYYLKYCSNKNHPLIEIFQALEKLDEKKNRKIYFLKEEHELALKYFWSSVKDFSEKRTEYGYVQKTLVCIDGSISKNSYGR